MPADYVLAIADSGVAADKTGSVRDDYNRASALAHAVTEIWNRVTRCDDPHLCAVLKRCQGQVGEIRAVLSAADHPLYSVQQLSDRLQHFAVEQLEILPAAVAALRAGDLAAFGAAVDLSQRQGAALLANQIPETVALAETARAAGAVAASAFGAGFGGSVWAMVRRQDAPAFLALWQSAYQARFAARNGRFFLTEAGPPAHALEA